MGGGNVDMVRWLIWSGEANKKGVVEGGGQFFERGTVVVVGNTKIGR